MKSLLDSQIKYQMSLHLAHLVDTMLHWSKLNKDVNVNGKLNQKLISLLMLLQLLEWVSVAYEGCEIMLGDVHVLVLEKIAELDTTKFQKDSTVTSCGEKRAIEITLHNTFKILTFLKALNALKVYHPGMLKFTVELLSVAVLLVKLDMYSQPTWPHPSRTFANYTGDWKNTQNLDL